MKYIIITLLLSALSYSQNTDSLRTTDIKEVILTKANATNFEKGIKIKWNFGNEVKFVSLVKNEDKLEKKVKELSFKIKNFSSENIPLKFIIYSNDNEKPSKELFSQTFNIEPSNNSDIINLQFQNDDLILTKDGFFAGVEFNENCKEKLYIYTYKSNNINTYIQTKGSTEWRFFPNEEYLKNFGDSKYVNIYYKMKIK